MLHLLHFADLDLARWEACVAASPGALPYVQAWWLRATAGRWAAVVERGPAGEYRSLLPLPTKWRPWGRVGYQPLFTQQLGLVLTPASQHRELAGYLLLVKKCCRQFYQQLPVGTTLPTLPPAFGATERLTYHLDLGPAVSMVRQGYAADYRRRLRRNAELAAPLTVTASDNLDDLLTLFLSYRGPEHTGLRLRHYAPLRRIWAAARARGLAELRQVRHPTTGELLAGALFIKYDGGLVYLFAAASEGGRAAGAPLLLLDEAVGRHAGQPGQVLDFEGGSEPAIGRFFANFGARPVVYSTLTLLSPNRLSAWMRP